MCMFLEGNRLHQHVKTFHKNGIAVMSPTEVAMPTHKANQLSSAILQH